jgi:soluble lytic murein transglycosylase-like protein
MRRLLSVLAPLTAIGLTACGGAAQSVVNGSPIAVRQAVPSASAQPAASASPSPVVVDASSVANELSGVEQAIRVPGVPEAQFVYLGQREQQLLHLLEAHPDWVATSLNDLPASIRPAIQADLNAAQQIGTLNGISPSLPHWKIIAPPAPDVLLSYYQEAQQAYGVPWPYLAAINLIETNMGRIQGLSSAGAQGPMQFMPSTWAYWGRGDVNNPHDAIMAAGRYLQGHGAPSDMTRAVYAYNPSMLYVRAVQLYAQQMTAEPNTFLAYYNWQVYVPTPSGNTLLPEGFSN